MLTKEEKSELIEKFGANSKDTGRSEVQIALLSKDIALLTEHLKIHKKDIVTRRSLLKKVAQRKRLLKYLIKTAPERYQAVIKELKLRK